MDEGDRAYAVFDHLLEGCQVIDIGFRYVYVNDAATIQAKKPREELIGHKMTEVYPGIENTHMFSLLALCLRYRSSQELDDESVYPDGSKAWFSLRMEPSEAGVFILSVDITRQKTAEIDMQSRLRRLTALREIDLATVNGTTSARWASPTRSSSSRDLSPMKSSPS